MCWSFLHSLAKSCWEKVMNHCFNTFSKWNKLHCPLNPRLLLTSLWLCSLDKTQSFIRGGGAVCTFFIFMSLFHSGARNPLPGTLHYVREFNGLLCPHCSVVHLGKVGAGLLLWGAAAGIQGEGLGAEIAVCLWSVQQVQLWLSRLQKGNSSFKGLNRCKKVRNWSTWQDSNKTHGLNIHRVGRMFSLSDQSPVCFWPVKYKDFIVRGAAVKVLYSPFRPFSVFFIVILNRALSA